MPNATGDVAMTGHGDVRLVVAGSEPHGTFEAAASAALVVRDLHRHAPHERVAVHAGVGPESLRRVQRLRDIANPGQIVVSSAASPLLATSLPAGCELRDAGVHRLRDLSPLERVFVLGAIGDGPDPPLCSVDAYPNNLPVQLSSFVGRTAETTTVRSLLAGRRLVTLVGSGGCGKTRLAAQAAAADIERWNDGVWWVPLQSVTDPRAVAAHVGDAVGILVEPTAGALRSLASELRDSRALVCLDNCEHVLGAVVDVVETLLRSCPEVSVLATSREPLNVPGEYIWRLPTMRDDEALDLFVERARQVRPSFRAEGDVRPVLRSVCRELDGIPLAIELAAAWSGSLSPYQIEIGLNDRFSLLVRGSRRAHARHQTLEASIDWSHDLLADRERILLRRLAVFSGGFTLDAARAICADDELSPAEVLPALDGLVAKSLVVVDEDTTEFRFRLRETIRQYAWRRLDAAGELSMLRDRHLGHLLATAEEAEPLLDHDKDTWCDLLDPEWENIRAALDWGLSAPDPEPGRRLAAATAWLWNLHGRGPEGLPVLRRAVERERTARTRLQARLMLGFALVGDTSAPGELDPVCEGAAIATELGDDWLRGRFLTLTAVGAFYNDNALDSAWDLCQQALGCAGRAGDEHGRDMASALQGLILHLRDRHAEALDLLGPVGQRLTDRGDRGIASTILVFQSSSAFFAGDTDRAGLLAEQAAKVAEPLADYHRVGTTRSQLALLRGFKGDIDGGLELLYRFLRVLDEAGTPVVVPGMARTLGLLHLWRGDLEESERWLTPSGLPTETARSGPLDPLAMAPLADALRRQGRLTDAEAVLDHAESLARRLGMPRVLADVLDQRACLVASADPAQGLQLLHDALQLRVDRGLPGCQVVSLEALAAILARSGRAADATRILATASAARARMELPRRPIDEPAHVATAAVLRAELSDDQQAAAWREGSDMTLAEAAALVRRTRGRRRGPATGWSSLTPTEMEVVRLVVGGLSNPQIAAKLFMSRSTVKTHLWHIFTKISVSNRTELAILASQHLPMLRRETGPSGRHSRGNAQLS
jgi:predicted ATPase/DNA-binding CsgD family transcriptional regulator